MAPSLPRPFPPAVLQLEGIAAAEESGDGASVFGLAAELLDTALEAEEAASLVPDGDGYEDLLRRLAAAAAAPDVQVPSPLAIQSLSSRGAGRFDALPALLGAA